MSALKKKPIPSPHPPRFYLNPNVFLPLIAFIIRFIYIIQRQSSPFFAAPEIDQAMHDLWAQQIANGDFWGHEAFFRAPLYYYFLGLLYYVFGHNYFIPRLVQILLGSYATWLTYRLGRRWRGETVGIIAGLLYAFCGPIIYYEGELLIPAVLLPLILLFLNQLDRQRLHPSGKGFFIAGIALGSAAIARPNILFYAPFVLAWIYWIIKGKRVWMLTFLAGAALIILPITARNYILSRDFVLVASQAGVNFYIGNNPYSNGYTAQVPGFPADWEGVDGSTKYAQQVVGRPLKPSEVSRFWFQRALGEMSPRPWGWIKLTLHKIRLLYSGVEISNNEDLYFQRRYSFILAALMWYYSIAFPYGLLVPLGILGLMLTWNWKRDAHIILYFIAYSISIFSFFVCTRYRLPLMPVLMIWTGAAFVEGHRLIRAGEMKRKILPLAVFIVLLIVVNINPIAGENVKAFEGTYYLGNKLFEQGRYREAESTYRQALHLDSTSALAHNGLGLTLAKLGETSEAQREFETALTYDSLSIQAHNNLAQILQKEGNLAEAAEHFRTVLRWDSTDAFAHRGLADIFLSERNFSAAENQYRHAYQDGAVDPQTISRWATAQLQQGKTNDALRTNAILLKLQPNNARVHHNQARLYIACDSTQKAIEELKIVLQLDPRNAEAKQQLEALQSQQ